LGNPFVPNNRFGVAKENPNGYVISGNKAFIVYRIDADHADWGTLNMSEVAIQE
jgi:hypothetical protein